jgi:hypothetical protein
MGRHVLRTPNGCQCQPEQARQVDGNEIITDLLKRAHGSGCNELLLVIRTRQAVALLADLCISQVLQHRGAP